MMREAAQGCGIPQGNEPCAARGGLRRMRILWPSGGLCGPFVDEARHRGSFRRAPRGRSGRVTVAHDAGRAGAARHSSRAPVRAGPLLADRGRGGADRDAPALQCGRRALSGGFPPESGRPGAGLPPPMSDRVDRARAVRPIVAQPRPARNPRGIRTAAGTDAAGTDAAVSVRSIDSDRRLALASGG